MANVKLHTNEIEKKPLHKRLQQYILESTPQTPLQCQKVETGVVTPPTNILFETHPDEKCRQRGNGAISVIILEFIALGLH